MTVWQIMAGSGGRDYAEVFLRHGLAFVGGENKCATMEWVNPGDRVILKRGLTEIVAAGVVVERDGKHRGRGDKAWLLDFDGWSLEAWCYVDWHRPAKSISTRGLTRATIQEVHQEHLIAEAERIIEEEPAIADFALDPPETREVTDDEILSFLIGQGLRTGAAEELTQTLRRVRLLAQYYINRDWELTNEHDTRAFLVVPFLLALGWSEQQMRLEWNIPGAGRADIACFRGPFLGDDDKCVMLVEIKSLNQGLDYAPEQARAYAEKCPDCGVVVVTNGYSYKVYPRTHDGSFPAAPFAYLNLLKPRDRYPIDPKTMGAQDALGLMLPRAHR